LQSYVSNFTELSRFPSVRRDIALLISDNINVNDIQQLIKQTGGELLDSTWLFDVYTGKVLNKASALSICIVMATSFTYA
jgi:phenylalanyl-tRNA synthetase beta chain